MFDQASVLRTEELTTWVGRLAVLDADVDDAVRVRQLGVLESVKAACAAAQARVAVDFDVSQRAAQRAAGVPAGRVGAGIGEQVALARRESPTHGSRHLGLARALVTEMPHTLAALTEGRISEWRATLVTRATAVLEREDRAAVDAALAGRLDGLSDRAVDAAARAAAYEADPDAFVKQGRRAVGDRRVTIRPALDLMANVTGFLPMAQGVAVWAALHKYALARRAGGDERSLDQIRADTLVERVTGQASADAVPVEIELIITDTALFPTRGATGDTAAKHDVAASSAQRRGDPEAAPGGGVVPFAGDTGEPGAAAAEPAVPEGDLPADGDPGADGGPVTGGDDTPGHEPAPDRDLRADGDPEGGCAGADRSAGRCGFDTAASADPDLDLDAGVDRISDDARVTDRGSAGGQEATRGPFADATDRWRTSEAATPVVDLTSRARPTPRPPEADHGAAPAGAVAYLSGLGPIPAGTARDLLANAADGGARLWMRRVFTDPATGAITAMDTHRRRFPDWMRHLVRLRDQWCRTPWCGAPIRHIDHVTGHARGGPTSLANAQGLCERCNHAKETTGWSARPDSHPDDPTRARTSTPTGHTYHSTAPPALGVPPPQPEATSRSA